jgi:hypothetical protein
MGAPPLAQSPTGRHFRPLTPKASPRGLHAGQLNFMAVNSGTIDDNFPYGSAKATGGTPGLSVCNGGKSLGILNGGSAWESNQC